MSEEEGPFCVQLRLQCSPYFFALRPGRGSFIHAKYEWTAAAYECDGLCLTPERIRFVPAKRSSPRSSKSLLSPNAAVWVEMFIFRHHVEPCRGEKFSQSQDFGRDTPGRP